MNLDELAFPLVTIEKLSKNCCITSLITYITKQSTCRTIKSQTNLTSKNSKLSQHKIELTPSQILYQSFCATLIFLFP